MKNNKLNWTTLWQRYRQQVVGFVLRLIVIPLVLLLVIYPQYRALQKIQNRWRKLKPEAAMVEERLNEVRRALRTYPDYSDLNLALAQYLPEGDQQNLPFIRQILSLASSHHLDLENLNYTISTTVTDDQGKEDPRLRGLKAFRFRLNGRAQYPDLRSFLRELESEKREWQLLSLKIINKNTASSGTDLNFEIRAQAFWR